MKNPKYSLESVKAVWYGLVNLVLAVYGGLRTSEGFVKRVGFVLEVKKRWCNN